jgi:hypothetical protein
MFIIDYGSSFTNSIQLNEGEGVNQNPQQGSLEKHQNDIDTLISTND